MKTLFVFLLGLTLGYIAHVQIAEDDARMQKVSVDCLREVPRVVLVRGE